MKKNQLFKLMNKSDIILVAVLVVLAAILYAVMYFGIGTAESGGTKVAVVTYKQQEVLRIDMTVDGTYTVTATLGEVTIEVKDGAVRVEKETSPYHLCSIQGWVSHSNTPIICLPNDLVVVIENGGSGSEDVIIG